MRQAYNVQDSSKDYWSVAVLLQWCMLILNVV